MSSLAQCAACNHSVVLCMVLHLILPQQSEDKMQGKSGKLCCVRIMCSSTVVPTILFVLQDGGYWGALCTGVAVVLCVLFPPSVHFSPPHLFGGGAPFPILMVLAPLENGPKKMKRKS